MVITTNSPFSGSCLPQKTCHFQPCVCCVIPRPGHRWLKHGGTSDPGWASHLFAPGGFALRDTDAQNRSKLSNIIDNGLYDFGCLDSTGYPGYFFSWYLITKFFLGFHEIILECFPIPPSNVQILQPTGCPTNLAKFWYLKIASDPMA